MSVLDHFAQAGASALGACNDIEVYIGHENVKPETRVCCTERCKQFA
jgi:hypothetical protein